MTASRPSPSYDRAVVDGYALRSEDAANASEISPAILRVIGESVLGKTCKLRLRPNDAVAVATGSMLPLGADYVAPVEETELMEDRVAVKSAGRPAQNIVLKGADVVEGTAVISKDRRLRSTDLGLLKTLGVRAVSVRRLLVGIMSTGNELTDSSHAAAGKIVDSNRVVLSSMVAGLGATPVDMGIVKDREAELLRMFRRAVGSFDIVLVTGGSSVGTRDLVPACINKLGKPGLLVHGVAMRPSMPTGLGSVKGIPIMSLPGVPVSALFAFQVFGRPAITKMLGLPEPFDHVVKAKLAGRIRGILGYRVYARVQVRKGREAFVAEPLKEQRSSFVTSIVNANGYVTVPEEVSEIAAGEMVDVTLTGDVTFD